jgi:N utilization substance protein A
MKGSRVQSVVQELRGEKIDIVPWNPDPAKFIVNALAPAEIVRVIIDEANRTMEVVVPDDQLSLAIGKKGQNVRLASKLTGWRIDVTSETRYNNALRDGYNSLLSLEGVGERTAESLSSAGIASAYELAQAQVDELLQIDGIGAEKAENLIKAAKNLIAQKIDEEEAKAAPPQEEE